MDASGAHEPLNLVPVAGFVDRPVKIAVSTVKDQGGTPAYIDVVITDTGGGEVTHVYLSAREALHLGSNLVSRAQSVGYWEESQRYERSENRQHRTTEGDTPTEAQGAREATTSEILGGKALPHV